MRRFTRYRSLGASLALLSSSALFAPALAQDKITLEVWSWQVQYEENYERIFEIYEAQNPHVEVDFRGFVNNEYPTIVRTALSAEGGPDIVMMHPYHSIAPYVRAGQLTTIDAESVPELANFTEESVAAATLDGRVWGVPFALQTLQVFYNADIFEELGISPPTRASDVEPMLQTIRDAGLIPYALTGNAGWQLVNLFDILVGNTYGGRDFLEAAVAGDTSFDSEPMIAAFEQYAAMKDDFPPFVSGVGHPDARALFVSGRAAMFPGGTWELALVRQNAPDMNIGVFSMPADDEGGPAPTWGYEDGSFAISAMSWHPEEALALLRWMATPEFGEAFTEEVRQLSSVEGVTPGDPLLADMARNFAANPVPMVWVTEYFGTSAPAPFTTLGVLLANLMVDATDPAAAAAQIEADAREFKALNQ